MPRCPKEYSGFVPPEEREALVKQLQEAFKELVQEDITTEIRVVDRKVAQEECARLQENFNIDDFTSEQEVRIVTVAGWTCPCGGTHMKSSKDLFERRWGVTGLKCKKGVVRVKYGQDTY
jgi:Ser-tRNA(Ala) deacylase AlaX